MIEEHGRVVSVETGAVRVETVRKSTCSSCNARNGCGQYLIEKYKSNHSHSCIRANADNLSIHEHDEVIIGIPGKLPDKGFISRLFSASAGYDAGDLGCLVIGPWVIWLRWLWRCQPWGWVICLCVFLDKRRGDMCRVSVVRVLPRQTKPELIAVTDLAA